MTAAALPRGTAERGGGGGWGSKTAWGEAEEAADEIKELLKHQTPKKGAGSCDQLARYWPPLAVRPPLAGGRHCFMYN
jgi:hypothetical protein